MKVVNFLFLATSFITASAYAEPPRVGYYPSTYHTAHIKSAEMNCPANEVREVFAPDNTVITQLCQKVYSNCLFYGACTIEDSTGNRIGINFYKYDEEANRSYFSRVDLKTCPFGYGFGKVSEGRAGTTCLLPYFTVAADPLEHSLGDVIFLPFLQGLALPTGEIHDGYLIVADYTTNGIGTGFDKFDFFTGNQSKKDPANAFMKTQLSHPDNKFEYQVITGKKAAEILQKRNFKILKTYKRVFRPKNNPMLGN